VTKQIVIMVALVACMIAVPGPSAADPVHLSVSAQAGPSTDTGLFNGTHLLSSSEAKAARFAADSGMASTLDMIAMHWFQTCLHHLSVCMPDGRLDAMLSLTDQTTLIGHLTLDEYAALAEVAAVIEMFLTPGTLIVRFLGGAWPGSALSIFETSFPF
jgi:hypothetical protein